MSVRFLNMLYALLFCAAFLGCKNNDAAYLEEGFINPSEKVQTSVYWYWIAGNISEEGVRKDLYAMKEAGINRAFIGMMDVQGIRTPYDKVEFGSEEWWKILHTALKTATDLGIEIGIFNSPGWSQSGGPWIKPEQAMRYLTSTSCRVEGGRKINLTLDKPDKDFQDVKVLAFPAGKPEKKLTSGKIVFNKDDKSTLQVKLESKDDLALRSVLLYPSDKPINTKARLYIEEKGKYKQIDEFVIDRFNASLNVGFKPYSPIVISVPACSSKDFMIEFDSSASGSELKDIVLSSASIVERYPEKTLAKMYQTPLPYWEEYQWREQPVSDNESYTVKPEKVLDISSFLNDNILEWDAPEGEWIIMRMGMSPTGVTNSPAEPIATGLEVDKMSRKHVESHFMSYMGEIIRRIPEADRKCWKVVVQDSYETGGQNFTDDFLESFKSRYGYDPLPFLPVYEGYVVENQDRSDRFLWDVRRLVADRIAYDYVGGLRDISHKYGLRTWLENYGHWGFPGEFLQYGGQSDEIGGEFWSFGSLGDIENRAASSCGHIYGKQLISAESFTSGGRPFNCYPAMMKQRGDRFFSEGINNTLLHLFISQPSDERLPGVNAWFSSEFNRLNTWFSQMDLFVTYLKRTNYMLQQGLNVADVAYFIGEDAPKMTGITEPSLPKGYQFDYINAEVIERDLYVEDGLLTLPHGTQYKMLVLPELKTMRPELLKKIKELVENGAVVLGPAPVRSPSGENYGTADKQVKTLADSLWQGIDGNKVRFAKRGKGLLIYGMDMKEALAVIDCIPDCKLPDETPVLYNHRRTEYGDIYFVTNQSDSVIELSPEFRVGKMQPELWNSINGKIRRLPAFEFTGSGVKVPLKLEPFESVFIVFREKAHTPVEKMVDANFPTPKTLLSLNNDWMVVFSDSLRGPKGKLEFKTLKDISECKEELIRYYSGKIVYTKNILLDEIPDGEIYLNLNKVGVMAKVKVNGQYAGGVWTPPYKLDVTGYLKKGNNKIEIDVVTTWQNRLIGDSNLPEDERTTWTACNNWSVKDDLQMSGLVGPVTLEVIEK
ncbi:MAG: glycosyl hydrolase [Parabacteroides sp.]|nr:glycosyl hydrolase [Parabacteroides sp.]